MPETTQEAQAIELSTKHSIREFAPNIWGGLVGDGIGYFMPAQTDIIPSWGTPACDWWLRLIDITQHGALWSGAKQVWTEKFLSTPYEISGGRNQTYQWQDIFFESDFGEGYDFMMQKAIADYLTLNRGLFLELVSYGDPDTPLQDGARIIGINHLDALRIVYTGNREWPYIYYSEYTSKPHRLHYTRVINLTNQPSPNTRMMGMGKSALYNAITVANAQILLGRHQNELLNDQPPPGLVLFQNVNPEQIDGLMRQFEADRQRDGEFIYRPIVRLSSVDPANPATVQFIPLSSVPEDFSYDKYMQQHVNLLALTMGLDPQDIWPLMGQAMGTGAQSKELAAKTEIKGPGYFATRAERMWNKVIPRGLEWKYKAQNGQQDLQQASIAEKWTAVINGATFMSESEKRQMAADVIPQFADVLLDEQGNVRLPDDDPKIQGQEVIATDNVEVDTPDNASPEATAGDNAASDTGTAQPPVDENGKPVKAKQPPVKPKPLPDPTPQSMAADASNKFNEVKAQLEEGLITFDEAQRRMGIPVDPALVGLYMVEKFPVPKDKIAELWQVKFGRGVASFDAVVSGATVPTGNGAGPVPESAVPVKTVSKSIDDTTSAFVDEIAAAMQDGVDGAVTKASTAARMRGAITRYGKLAYQDGLEDGGVDDTELDEDDKLAISDMAVHDTQYVSDLVNEIYSEAGMKGTVENRAPLWASTLNEFYYAGLASADANGLYEFVGDDGKENCATCARLKGQVHRMKDWVRKELRPGVDHHNFDCGTWEPNCAHYLEKTTGKAYGNW